MSATIASMDTKLLKKAIEQSRESVSRGAFPVGVVIAMDGEPFTFGISNGKQLNDPTSHAEIAAMRDACSRLRTRSLKSATLYSSMEPCLMCYAACVWASIPRVVYACGKDKLSSMHFEGAHNLDAINKHTRKPIELVHITDLEGEALKVITDWEATLAVGR